MSAKAHPGVRQQVIVNTRVAIGLEGPFARQVNVTKSPATMTRVVYVPNDREDNPVRQLSGVMAFDPHGSYISL